MSGGRPSTPACVALATLGFLIGFPFGFAFGTPALAAGLAVATVALWVTRRRNRPTRMHPETVEALSRLASR